MGPERKISDAEKISKEIKLKSNLQLTELNLSGLKLTSVPEEVTFPRSLTLLNISQNGLELFPKQICDLESLKSLNISNNFISQWASDGSNKNVEFKSSKSLTEFDLSNNQFVELPPWLGQLRRLRVLILDFNPVFSLQESVRLKLNWQYFKGSPLLGVNLFENFP